MSARAGVLVTGTEVLSGIISDRNGPWLTERLRALGVDAAHIVIVGDRPEDMLAVLEFMASERLDLIVTSGGLGPTADDLTAEVVGRFCGREMVLDPALEARIAEILRPMLERWPELDPEAIRHSNRKQAVIPEGATVLDPVGTAPGLVVTPADGAGPTVVVLPGPPRELKAMWEMAITTDAFRTATAGATTYQTRVLRLFGIPESAIADTLRAAADAGIDLASLEVTTCLRRGEIEIATRYEPAAEDVYEAFADFVRGRHADTLFSEDGSTIDDQVAALLAGRTIAVAESCTGGLMAARLTDRAGSSAYFKGGLVVYSNEAKVALAGVDPGLIERHGAVSPEVAEALAQGAVDRLDAQVGVGITGIAGPGGGTAEKPVGLVYFSVRERGGGQITRKVNLPGNRADIRERSTVVAMHLVRRLLEGTAASAGSVEGRASAASVEGTANAASVEGTASAGSVASSSVASRRPGG